MLHVACVSFARSRQGVACLQQTRSSSHHSSSLARLLVRPVAKTGTPIAGRRRRPRSAAPSQSSRLMESPNLAYKTPFSRVISFTMDSRSPPRRSTSDPASSVAARGRGAVSGGAAKGKLLARGRACLTAGASPRRRWAPSRSCRPPRTAPGRAAPARQRVSATTPPRSRAAAAPARLGIVGDHHFVGRVLEVVQQLLCARRLSASAGKGGGVFARIAPSCPPARRPAHAAGCSGGRRS